MLYAAGMWAGQRRATRKSARRSRRRQKGDAPFKPFELAAEQPRVGASHDPVALECFDRALDHGALMLVAVASAPIDGTLRATCEVLLVVGRDGLRFAGERFDGGACVAELAVQQPGRLGRRLHPR